MSLVNREDLDKLRTAEEALETAETSEDEIQLKAVAYAINSASNTGQTRVVFQEKLRTNTISELEMKGYTISYIGAAAPERQALISWKPRPVAEPEETTEQTEENNG